MDRRGFLKVVGLGGLAVAAAPKLVVPAMRQMAVPDPQRRVFLPPAGGWPGGAAFNWSEWAVFDPLPSYSYAVTTYDISTFEPLPSRIFEFGLNDIVQVEFGRGAATIRGAMVVTGITSDSVGPTRVQGVGVESYAGQKFGPPIATIRGHSGMVSRSVEPGFGRFYGSNVAASA